MLVSAKHNHVRIDGKTHQGFGLPLTTGAVNGRDEITKCQWFFVVRFHNAHLSFG